MIGWTLVALLAAGTVSAQTTHKVKVVQYSDDLGAADVEAGRATAQCTRTAHPRKAGSRRKIRDARQTVKKELALTTLALENCRRMRPKLQQWAMGRSMNVQLGAPQPVIPIAPAIPVEELPEPMLDPAFQALKSTIKNQSFSDDKLVCCSRWSPGNCSRSR